MANTLSKEGYVVLAVASNQNTKQTAALVVLDFFGLVTRMNDYHPSVTEVPDCLAKVDYIHYCIESHSLVDKNVVNRSKP